MILDYWATWCGPCVREIPHLQKVADEFPQDLVVVATDKSRWLPQAKNRGDQNFFFLCASKSSIFRNTFV